MIGIQLAGKNERISATAFVRSLENFLELVKNIDSVVSQHPSGSVRWELTSLKKSSPALVEFVGVSRLKTHDYTLVVQQSLLGGISQLSERPEQPEYYSYSALRNVQRMAEQAKSLKWLNVVTEAGRVFVDQRVSNNVEHLMSEGSTSFGSIRGSLDAITVHSGHEFRVWPSVTTKLAMKRPVTCRFKKSMLSRVLLHIKQEVEVFGELKRNSKGEPVVMAVEDFLPMEPVTAVPSIAEMSGLIGNLYEGKSLRDHMEEIRNG